MPDQPTQPVVYIPQDNPYPRMLYREAAGDPMLECNGRALDHRTVGDAAEEEAARADGWHDHPVPGEFAAAFAGRTPVAAKPKAETPAQDSAELDALRKERDELLARLADAEPKPQTEAKPARPSDEKPAKPTLSPRSAEVSKSS